MAQTVGLQVLRELVKAVIKAELSIDNKAYPNILIDDSINWIYQDIINWTLEDPRTNETVEKTNLTFLEEDVFFSSVLTVSLDENTVVGAEELSFNTDWYLDSWAVWVEWNIITYSWKTATELTWIPTTWEWSIKFPHIWGTRVRQLFTLPDNYNYTTKVRYDYKAPLLPQDYRKFLERYRNRFYNDLFIGWYNAGTDGQPLRTDVFYTIVKDTYLLPIIPEVWWKPLQLLYQKWVDDMVNSEDICEIPDKYCKRSIKYIAASNVVADRWELDIAWAWYTRGIKEVKKMYKVESSKTRELQFWSRVWTSSDNILNI